MAGQYVIQGFFPDGPRRATHSQATAQAKTGRPPWVQEAIARHEPGIAQPKTPVAPASSRIVPLPARPQHAVIAPPGFAPVAGGGGQRLPLDVRQKMEACFGTSFADVRIHVGPLAPSIGAVAFTEGSNIHFAPGRYDPSTERGRQILGHELAHVVQQRTGRVRNPFGTGVAVVQDPALEAEAERMSRRASVLPVVQRASSSMYTRGRATDESALIEASSELLGLYDGVAAALGYDSYSGMSGAEQRDFMLLYKEYVAQPRSRKAPSKAGSGKAELVDFTCSSGKTYKGLEPGGDYYARYQIEYTGTRTGDFLQADLALFKAGLGHVRTKATVWHHYHDYDKTTGRGTLYLMDRSVHDTMKHHGGMFQYNGSL